MKKILLCLLAFFPTFVFASEMDLEPLGVMLFVEAFVTIHMTSFVLKPLSEIFSKGDSKKLFWKLFWIRIAVLLFFDFFITVYIGIIDFIFVFIGAFILVPVCTAIKSKKNFKSKFNILEEVKTCEKCNALIKTGFKFCENCGSEIVEKVKAPLGKLAVKTQSFDYIYRLPEDRMVEEFILRELKSARIDNTDLIPAKAETRKIILNIIFSVLLFVYISLIFFHFPLLTYIIGFIVLLILFFTTRKFNFMKYLVKELKSRPGEKISNVVMSVKQTLKVDNSKKVFIGAFILAIVLPIIIFMNPRIMYESVDGGYAVRFYTFGITNFKTASIPQTYKGKDVVALRGNTFSNMFFLENVKLPDNIKEIRGQAFYNCINLKSVNIPKKLEYLGGGAFYNVKSITHITLPDGLEFIGGEAFYNAKNLVSINLPKKLTEIRGSTFENCTSLDSINIPDQVTRIGGHAFYGCSSLSNVSISENSQLSEIGSSAFRKCSNLYNITLPDGVYVNERAFKESPTSINYEYNNKNRIVDNHEAMLTPHEKITYSQHNISVFLESYIYNESGLKEGTFIIDFNDGVNQNIKFDFSSTDFLDRENDVISFTYLGYHFRITNFKKQEVGLLVTKNTDYSNSYNKNISFFFAREGENYTLPNTNLNIKLDKKELVNKRYNFHFSCNGYLFEEAVGNGYFNNADFGKNVKIQIDSFYESNGVYLKIYYN